MWNLWIHLTCFRCTKLYLSAAILYLPRLMVEYVTWKQILLPPHHVLVWTKTNIPGYLWQLRWSSLAVSLMMASAGVTVELWLLF